MRLSKKPQYLRSQLFEEVSKENISKVIKEKVGEVSTVNTMSIQQETISRLNRFDHIDAEKKRLIRAEGVYNLVKSKESGHLFALTDLIKAAGFYPTNTTTDKQYYRGCSFINNLVQLGVLRRYREGANRLSKASYDIDSLHVLKAKLKYLPRGRNKAKDPRIVITTVEEATKAQHPVAEPSYELKDTPEPVKAEEKTAECSDYSFTFTIRKKSQSLTGDKEIANVSLHETTLEKITEIVNNVIKVSK